MRQSGERSAVRPVSSLFGARRGLPRSAPPKLTSSSDAGRLDLLQAEDMQGVQLGMTFLDGTSIRAHQKAAGAARKGALQRGGTPVRPWAGLVVGMGPKRA